ncbi:hypothetical protein AMAG_04380 [Allomyces macrogynus ATCC 38327]|uniref:Uncharacterized protein n=1 Tax=Allomyces macrogynus (strain ATCC 38327) TaxID=578462 RepID=A0A0L0S8T3_ALLM3|nr:hypothetical protein AMAG_04380 [Allomyces macrogynus ATCC 38327]|eukprot:KNE58836.1 hypothetical protein AMAG_04380 [Allomyces macrogynus ATCC 38327]
MSAPLDGKSSPPGAGSSWTMASTRKPRVDDRLLDAFEKKLRGASGASSATLSHSRSGVGAEHAPVSDPHAASDLGQAQSTSEPAAVADAVVVTSEPVETVSSYRPSSWTGTFTRIDPWRAEPELPSDLTADLGGGAPTSTATDDVALDDVATARTTSPTGLPVISETPSDPTSAHASADEDDDVVEISLIDAPAPHNHHPRAPPGTVNPSRNASISAAPSDPFAFANPAVWLRKTKEFGTKVVQQPFTQLAHVMDPITPAPTKTIAGTLLPLAGTTETPAVRATKTSLAALHGVYSRTESAAAAYARAVRAVADAEADLCAQMKENAAVLASESEPAGDATATASTRSVLTDLSAHFGTQAEHSAKYAKAVDQFVDQVRMFLDYAVADAQETTQKHDAALLERDMYAATRIAQIVSMNRKLSAQISRGASSVFAAPGHLFSALGSASSREAPVQESIGAEGGVVPVPSTEMPVSASSAGSGSLSRSSPSPPPENVDAHTQYLRDKHAKLEDALVSKVSVLQGKAAVDLESQLHALQRAAALRGSGDVLGKPAAGAAGLAQLRRRARVTRSLTMPSNNKRPTLDLIK